MGKFNLSSELFAIILFRKIQLIVGIGMAWKLTEEERWNERKFPGKFINWNYSAIHVRKIPPEMLFGGLNR